MGESFGTWSKIHINDKDDYYIYIIFLKITEQIKKKIIYIEITKTSCIL